MNRADKSGSEAGLGPRGHVNALSTSFAASYAGIMAFMAVAREGSFTKASESLGIGRSAVSRNVQKLEKLLMTRLFLRTTRTTQLTREGERFFENCRHGVAHFTAAMNEMLEMRQGPPRGLLRIRSTADFGRKVVAPLLEAFVTTYPDISVDLQFDDRPTDFATDQIDIAFRNGRIEDSSIIARRLTPMQLALCAAPSYVRKYGLPQSLDDLPHHECINFRSFTGRLHDWEFNVDGAVQKYTPTARMTFNDADLVLKAVLRGWGIAQLAEYQIGHHVEKNELVVALGRHSPEDLGHYICYLSRQHLPTRVRIFIDFMAEHIREQPLHRIADWNARDVDASVPS